MSSSDGSDPLLEQARFLIEIGQPAAALHRLEQDTLLSPEDKSDLQGQAFLALNRPEDALAPLRLALKHRQDDPVLAVSYIKALDQSGHRPQALHMVQALRRRFPDDLDLLRHEARLHRGLDDPDSALRCLHQARALVNRADTKSPHRGPVLRDLGQCLRALERLQEAADALADAVDAMPRDGAALSSYGTVLDLLGREDEAHATLAEAIAADPHEPDWLYNYAVFLAKRDGLEAALPMLETAIALDTRQGGGRPTGQRAHLWTNLGICRLGLGDGPGAVAAHEESRAQDPTVAEARYALSWALLMQGDFAAGWHAHEARLDMPGSHGVLMTDPDRLWDGAPLADPTGRLWIHAEQGLGDTIMTARLIPQARRQSCAASVTVICHPALHPLLASMPEIDTVIPLPNGETEERLDTQLTAGDRHIPMMSLPDRLTLRPENLPGPVPYLHAPTMPPRVPLSATSTSTSTLRIGVVWAGAADNPMDRLRSCPWDTLGPWTERLSATFPALRWVSLQIDADPRTLPDGWDTPLTTARHLGDTATVLAGLDAVVGVDTAVTHLAGAMGIPVGLLLAFSPDYRWGLNGDRSPWYPHHRLFRQSRRHDWSDPLDCLAHRLLVLARQKAHPSDRGKALDFFTN